MSEMVARVAKSLGTVTTGPEAGGIVISEMFSADLWAMMAENLARAAIEAMREPTDDVLAVFDEFGDGDSRLILWNRMLDAALTEKPRT